jgi:hypothetical protein
LTRKIYTKENNEHDLLMDVFGISPELKRENRQYWGRELGMCWQLLIVELCRQTRNDFGGAIRIGSDEPCDLTIGNIAIDTKYRIGSGDSGTLKKFKANGLLLRSRGYAPILLVLRTDNLQTAIGACKAGGWEVITGEEAFSFIRDLTKFDIRTFLVQKAGEFAVRK